MAKNWLNLFFLVSNFLAVSSSLAAVNIKFDNPSQFTDLSMSGGQTQGIQDYILKEFEQYCKVLGERYFPKSNTLEIVVKNIDMAGSFEPWQTPYLTHTRIMRDIYPPKITLHYRWLDASGAVLADKEETLSDLNYLMLADSRQYSIADPLRYEKAMLARWFVQTFAPKP